MPQWNCGCPNCRDARLGRIPALTQSSIAIRDDQGAWFLVNASPDLRFQISAFPDLQPRPGALRGTPIAGVLLTNADLDHVAGLLFLREGGRLQIYATRPVRETLSQYFNLAPVLDAFCGADWHEAPQTDFVPLAGIDGAASSLSYRAIALHGGPPMFAWGPHRDGVHCAAYSIVDKKTGGRLLVAPDVACCNDALAKEIRESDAVLFDGTFWSDDELMRVKNGARTAAEMGHATIKDQTLPLLAKSPAKRKFYIHINNTNPVLAPGSPERTAVEAAGIGVGFDGLEFDL